MPGASRASFCFKLILLHHNTRTGAEMPMPQAERRLTVQIREREILRVSGQLRGNNQITAATSARQQALQWAQTKAVERFSSEAWSQQPFEQLSSGRSRIAVRLADGGSDIWAIRVEDPDREAAGRIWTTEISVTTSPDEPARFTTRLLVSSPENSLGDVEPHVPGVVRQVIRTPGLFSGIFRLTDQPVTIRTESDTVVLIDALLDQTRTLPLIVLSVPSSATDPERPLLDARALAQACAGLATVVILPAELAWNLTERFGKRLSVYEGAVRIYLQGFTEDANPFGGHDLILPDRFSNMEGAALTLKRLRWSAALGSLTRLSLGVDVPSFASLRLTSLEKRQEALRGAGANDFEQLAAAQTLIETLETRAQEAERYLQQFSDLHDQAEERAQASEAQVLASGFRIRQLLDQITQTGTAPDSNIAVSDSWDTFAEWCDTNLAGRVILAPQARRSLRFSVFEDVGLAGRCLLWLANDFRELKLNGGDGSLRDLSVEQGITNTHCGSDSFHIEWQNKRHDVDWHIKSGGKYPRPPTLPENLLLLGR
jgi:hypothetical protein